MDFDSKAIGGVIAAAVIGLGGGGVVGIRNADCSSIHESCVQEKREMRDFFLRSSEAGYTPAVYTYSCPDIPCADRPGVCEEIGCGTCNVGMDRCEQ